MAGQNFRYLFVALVVLSVFLGLMGLGTIGLALVLGGMVVCLPGSLICRYLAERKDRYDD